jgi:hypothetical protein
MMKLTVVNSLDGMMRVHKAGCADIKREVRKANGHFAIDVTTRKEVVDEVWSDFITGDEDEDQIYWETTHFAPCVKLPDGS